MNQNTANLSHETVLFHDTKECNDENKTNNNLQVGLVLLLR